MNYRSHRYDDCCESSEPRSQPAISWPQRSSLPNFPGIAMFWPMPFAIPMWPSMGSWGGMGSGSESSYYSHRRHDMYHYRCCEPRYGRHQCCERCGEYDCRCERRCERCGEYDCRCERRCERCGRRNCRCGAYVRYGGVRLTVAPSGSVLNFKVSMDPAYLDADAQPVVQVLREGVHGYTIGNIGVLNNPGDIEIRLALDPTMPSPGCYVGPVYDSRHLADGPIAYLKIIIY